MWHEARRQERKIRGMLVDYRRRAERRRDFYEKIKADPTQFLQVHGRQYKIHLDPAIAAAADSASAMMPWQGQSDNLIDRFDVRAHLDYIPPVKKDEDEEVTFEERQINYERYRIIAQNSFLTINEEKFLKQLHLEEQFGYTESKSKKEQRTGATIGFNYEDNTAQTAVANYQEDSENSDSDLDVDLSINVSKIDSVQAHEMNRHGRNFGMSSNDFYSFLTNDLEEAESFRLAKEEEHEKALFSGRKSRRERRAHREKRLANRVISPPSYAARISPTYPSYRKSKSLSKSPSPENAGKITYITSFGDEEETPSTSRLSKTKRTRKNSSTERVVYRSKNRSYSKERTYKRRSTRSRSRTRRRSYSKKSRSRSRSHSRARRRKRSLSSSSSSSSSTSSSSSSSSSSTSSRSLSPKVPPTRVRSKSKSPIKKRSLTPTKDSPPKVIPRYYGRKKSDQSSSELSDSSNKEDENKAANSPANSEKWSGYGNSGNVSKKSTQNLTIQERLKRKRQALLNKQFKADKIAEQLKTEREKQEQQHREDELREMALKLRRRQREKRHAYDSSSNSSDSDSTKSPSPPPTVENKPKSPSPHVSRREEHKESRRYERYDSGETRAQSRERKDRSRERRRSSSSEKRVVYREKRRRDERDRVYERDRERRDRSNRSLVDY